MWSKERIWNWYNERPWIRGCNFMSSDCANRVDQWQSYGFEERFETTERELALLAETGMNAIRVIVEFVVWDQEHDSFMERFDRYLALCAKYGVSCMVVLGNDCMRPKGYELNKLGEQPVDWGYHGGRKISQHGGFAGMGDHVLDDPEQAERYFEMVREIVETHKNDPRINIWNVYNEVGNSKREQVTLPNLKRMFEIIRGIDPIQPLTCEVWTLSTGEVEDLPEVQQYALHHSDLISYHSYANYATNVQIISTLKQYGRPILCTEWLARGIQNTVQELFPLFYLEKIGCYNWGFVVGKYQTHEPWNNIWEQYEQGMWQDFDFTKWFHDLYRMNHRPYDPKEIELIKCFCKLADKNEEKRRK